MDDNARGRGAIELLLVWAVFVLHAGFLIPDVNEPNYLAKAKHYWDPNWCPNDFFLQTADAHVVFYWSFGWLTLLMPLPVVTWIGRLVTCAMLAYGWRRLSRMLAPRFGYAVLSAGLLVALNSRVHMAGEWVVGGFEAKGFAYAFVFLGLADIVANYWNRAWLLLGIATAIHVLVGGWSLIIAGFAWCCLGNETNRPPLRDQWQGLVGGALLSLPGVIPLLWFSQGVDSQVSQQALQIQVFDRLPHHLNPLAFAFQLEPPYLTWFAIRFGLLVGAWCLLVRYGVKSLAERRLSAYVGGTILLVAIGLTIGLATYSHQAVAARLLRFYWFRLPDVILPAAVALMATAAVCRSRVPGRRWAAYGLVGVVALHLTARTWTNVSRPVPPADAKLVSTAQQYSDWLDLCRHVGEVTPADAVFITPRGAHTFKWYAGRSEAATWKEMPQDAASVVEWWQRMETLHGIRQRRWKTLAQRSAEDMMELGRIYGADFAVVRAEPAIDLPVAFKNSSFVLYRLPAEPPASDSSP